MRRAVCFVAVIALQALIAATATDVKLAPASNTRLLPKSAVLADRHLVRPAPIRIAPGPDSFDFHAFRHVRNGRSGACDQWLATPQCYCGRMCSGLTCARAEGHQCRSNLYCDDCDTCSNCSPPP